MVSEEAALFRSEELFAAGIRDAFNRKTGRRPLRKVRKGLPEERDVVRALLLGRINAAVSIVAREEPGGMSSTSPEKQLGVSLSGRRIPACFLPCQGLVIEAGV